MLGTGKKKHYVLVALLSYRPQFLLLMIENSAENKKLSSLVSASDFKVLLEAKTP